MLFNACSNVERFRRHVHLIDLNVHASFSFHIGSILLGNFTKSIRWLCQFLSYKPYSNTPITIRIETPKLANFLVLLDLALLDPLLVQVLNELLPLHPVDKWTDVSAVSKEGSACQVDGTSCKRKDTGFEVTPGYADICDMCNMLIQREQHKKQKGEP